MKSKRGGGGQPDGLGLLGQGPELVNWAILGVGPMLLVGATMMIAFRWRHWPLGPRYRGRLPRWTWAPLLATPLGAAGTLAVVLGQAKPAVALISACVGAVAAAIGGWDGERYDKTAPRAALKARQRRRVGPLQLLRGHLQARAFATRVVPYIERAEDSEELALAFGRDERKMVRGLTGLQASRCGLIVGGTGSGKSWSAHKLAQASVLGKGSGLIWCEAKGEGATLDRLAALSIAAERPFYIFDVAGRGQPWDPFQSAATVLERRDLLYKALEASFSDAPEYYRGLFREHAYAVFQALQVAGEEPTISNVRSHWPANQLQDLVADLDHPTAHEVARYCRALTDNRQRREGIEGVGGRVNELDDVAGTQLRPPTDGEHQLRLDDAMQQGAICLFRLEAQKYPEASKSLGQLLIADLAATGQPFIDRRQPANCLVVLDEFGRYTGPGIQPLMALTARAAGIAVTIATQDISDVEAVQEYFLQQNSSNLGWLLAGLASDPDSADWLARFSGQKEIVESTRQTMRWQGDYDHESGRGTEAHGYEWHIHPHQLQALRRGEAGLMTKSPQHSILTTVDPPLSAPQLLALAPAPTAGKSWNRETLASRLAELRTSVRATARATS